LTEAVRQLEGYRWQVAGGRHGSDRDTEIRDKKKKKKKKKRRKDKGSLFHMDFTLGHHNPQLALRAFAWRGSLNSIKAHALLG
jgi:hypothetical protein